jgi:signal transduction histidine kinase
MMHLVHYRTVTDPRKLHALLDAVMVIESDLDLVSLLRRIVQSAVDLIGARYGALGVLDPAGSGLSEFVHVGVDIATTRRIGHLPEGRGILGLLIRHPQVIRLRNLADHPDSVGFPEGHPPMHSFIGVPIRVRGEIFGNLYLTGKQGDAEFSAEDEQLLQTLASAAGLAIENARLHGRVMQLTVSEDRERIARDLHDTVIQRIFAVALSLQAIQGTAQDQEIGDRLQTAIDDLDDTIRQVRTTIFALEPPPMSESGLRARALEICAEATRSLEYEPEILFMGPVDSVPSAVGTHALAVLREALSNVARHARAHRVEVMLSAAAEELHLAVTDDGVGVPGPSERLGKGLPNMAERAEALGGSFSLTSQSAGGARVDWRVPLG